MPPLPDPSAPAARPPRLAYRSLLCSEASRGSAHKAISPSPSDPRAPTPPFRIHTEDEGRGSTGSMACADRLSTQWHFRAWPPLYATPPHGLYEHMSNCTHGRADHQGGAGVHQGGPHRVGGPPRSQGRRRRPVNRLLHQVPPLCPAGPSRWPPSVPLALSLCSSTSSSVPK